MLLAEFVSNFMFGFEMKDVNGHDGMFKVVVFLFCEVSLQITVAIIKDNIWYIIWSRIHRLQKVLSNLKLSLNINVIVGDVHTFAPDIDSALYIVPRTLMIPQQLTISCSL